MFLHSISPQKQIFSQTDWQSVWFYLILSLARFRLSGDIAYCCFFLFLFFFWEAVPVRFSNRSDSYQYQISFSKRSVSTDTSRWSFTLLDFLKAKQSFWTYSFINQNRRIKQWFGVKLLKVQHNGKCLNAIQEALIHWEAVWDCRRHYCWHKNNN